jgi:DNA-binding winged helix-turn-helix (wHTH) protein/tetratricopeptide (TPR) repeat protein
MALGTRVPIILRFGTFEVDLRAGELRKQGRRIKLQDQPFQVLGVLLQRPGEVLTREELRTQIWPEDTFVDFDNSLNTCINKLREALGDSADNPRFIETLPRRGYRFLAPVTSTDHKESASVSPAGHLKLTVPVTVVLVLAAASGLFWRSRHRSMLTEKDTIVLGDFANSTGDPVFDGTLREGLSVQLEQSPFLSLVSNEGIHQTLRMMGQPANARLTPEITREVCQRTNSTTALDGSLALIGTRYDLILKAVNCVSGDVLASTESQSEDKSHVLDALGKVASEMRRRLGESLSSVQKYNTRLEQATTPSLEALQAYSLGFKSSWVDGDQAAALQFLERAIQLDPNFAMAYRAASNAYAVMNESTKAAENIRRAFELRGRASELERLFIEEDYDFFLTGDLLKARHIDELAIQTYSREPLFHFNLAVISNFLGQYETGLKEYREAFRRAPYNSFFKRGVIFTCLLSNRVEEAAAGAREAQTMAMDSHLAHVLYLLAFYRRESGEMARQAASASGKSWEEGLLLALEADTAAYSGHLQRAREFSLLAEDAAQQAGEKETAATYYAVSALREALFGNGGKSRGQCIIAQEHASGRDLNYACGLALAYAGDRHRAQAISDDLPKRFPEDTIIRFHYLPTLRAKLALIHGNPEKALEMLRASAPYELGLPAVGFYNWPNLYPVYVRGEAHLAARQGPEAATEFQKILDHRSIVLNEPIGSLAHLQLGRAYAMQGDTLKASTAYQDFLTLWKDADPDIPILKQAKAEYAKLN